MTILFLAPQDTVMEPAAQEEEYGEAEARRDSEATAAMADEGEAEEGQV